MTIGQRIAQKRKEQGLSQEALGDRLGISRQSIYKWESDAALPEIEKLVSLSRLFGVSVGWLLGVEEDAPPETAAPEEAAPERGGELTEAQLQMVEEIAGRYIAAQPPPKKSAWDKWSVRILFAMCGAMLGILVGISGSVKRLDGKYDSLQSYVSSVTDSVNNRIDGVSQQVESVWKAQNDLTADYGVEIISTNYKESRILFDVYAVPKTYVEDMKIRFYSDNGAGGRNSVEGVPLGTKFSATVVSALTDDITISAEFLYPDGTRQTQVLDAYEGLYSESLPYVDVTHDNLSTDALAEPCLFTIPAPNQSPVRYIGITRVETSGAAIRELRVGLFKNQKLVAWAQPCEKPEDFLGKWDYEFYSLPNLQERLAPGDTLCFAAVLTDEYDRVTICPGFLCTLDESGETLLHQATGFSPSTCGPEGWQFE